MNKTPSTLNEDSGAWKRCADDIVRVGQRLWQQHMVAGIDGNISARLSATRLMITGGGTSLGALSPADVVVCDLETGLSVDDTGLTPSSELPLHTACLSANPKANAVVHAHPPYATALGVVSRGIELPWLTNTVIQFGVVPVVPYETPGSERIAESVALYARNGHKAMILEHHGALAMGRSVDDAYLTFEQMEHLAKTYLIASQSGFPRCLSRGQMHGLLQLRERFAIDAVAPVIPSMLLTSRLHLLRVLGYWLRGLGRR